MALELFNGNVERSGAPVDIYAFAATAYSMFTPPLELDDKSGMPGSVNQLMLRVYRGARLVRSLDILHYYWGLMTSCWNQLRQERPTFRAILDEFVDPHACALPAANIDTLLAYKPKVYERFSRADGNWKTMHLLPESDA
jgi:hypothetical protein